MTPQEASDHLEITQLLQRYFVALDEKNYAMLEKVFTPDALLHYDMKIGAKERFPDMVERFREFNAAFYFTQHVMGQPLIELDGDAARSRASLRALHVQRRRGGGHNSWVVYGFYRDLHTRTEAGWRIRERYFKGTHFEGEVLPADQVQLFPEAPWR